MFYLNQEYSGFLEERKSKFYAFLLPYNHFYKRLSDIKLQHPKANHFVFAYRYFNNTHQIIENANDDGEPKGTSGRPILNILSGNNIINTGLIVVRYFGGTKLGTGGLVRAYTGAAQQALKVAKLLPYALTLDFKLQMSYTDVSKVEYLLNQLGIDVLHKHFDQEVFFLITITESQLALLRPRLPLGTLLCPKAL